METRTFTVTKTYELGLSVSEGSMADIYEAVDSGIGRRVAVKCLRTEHLENAAMRERFSEEAAIMGRLDHPGALAVHEAGRLPDGRDFYTMRMVQGRTLRELLEARDARSVGRDRRRMPELLDVFERVCETVAYAHAQGIIHRDVKPENVLVDEFGSVFVVDWGLAKELPPDASCAEVQRTAAGVVMGTPGYMSPEQARGEATSTGCQTDVFALGVILYEILTGVRPFAGRSGREAILSVLYREAQDPRLHNPWIRRDLAAVCRRALEKDPQRRYASAKELTADVRAFREFRSVSAIRPRLRDRVTGLVQREPGRAALLSVVLSALLFAAAFVGTEVYLDHRLSVKGSHAVERIQAEVDDLARAVRKVEVDIASPNISSADRARLEARRRELEALRFAREVETVTILHDVVRLRFIRTNQPALDRARWAAFEAVRGGLAAGQLPFVKAFIQTVLQRYEAGNEMRYSAEEIARLRTLLAEAEEAIERDIRAEAREIVRIRR